jgi:hypothetical protein
MPAHEAVFEILTRQGLDPNVAIAFQAPNLTPSHQQQSIAPHQQATSASPRRLSPSKLSRTNSLDDSVIKASRDKHGADRIKRPPNPYIVCEPIPSLSLVLFQVVSLASLL